VRSWTAGFAQDRCVQVRGVDNEVGAFATVGMPEVQPLSLEVAQQTVVAGVRVGSVAGPLVAPPRLRKDLQEHG